MMNNKTFYGGNSGPYSYPKTQFRPVGLLPPPNRNASATKQPYPHCLTGNVKRPTAVPSATAFGDFPDGDYDDEMFQENIKVANMPGVTAQLPQSHGDGDNSNHHFFNQRHQAGQSRMALPSRWPARPQVIQSTAAPVLQKPRIVPQVVQIRSPYSTFQAVPSSSLVQVKHVSEPAAATFSEKGQGHRKEKSQLREAPPLCFMTVTINTMNQLNHYKDECKRLLEVFGVVTEIKPHPTNRLVKLVNLQDQGRTLQCVFSEIDRNLPPLNIMELHRCVGRMTPDNTFQCLSIRSVTQQEHKFRNRLAAISAKLTHSKMLRAED